MKRSKVTIIGSGFSGLSAASYLARSGKDVTIVEKNESTGGRARMFREQGFMFDMGPSWYWMPDIMESFFNDFGRSASDFYELKKLDPGFQVFFGEGDVIQIPDNLEALYALFETIEKGSAGKLKQFLSEGAFKYRVGMQKFAYKPALSWTEFINYDVIYGALRSHMFKSVRDYVGRFFKDKRLIAIMEFPVLFLGAKPSNIPALYSLMNYAALQLGTYYPMGGMYKVAEGMKNLAESLGVQIITSCEAQEIVVQRGLILGVHTNSGFYSADAMIASGDYHHVEQNLLKEEYRSYDEQYWDRKTFAPSCLIFYLGVNKKIGKLSHHNLFFDRNFDQHAAEIYDQPAWPSEPLFYVCCPSKTDDSVAPEGKENLFVLVPIAPGLKDTDELREHCFGQVIRRLEQECGETIAQHIVYKRSYCVNDFIKDYHAYKGNAYGLANTLTQTAVLKPSIRSKKVGNLFYAGQLTVPGPGVPPAIISGHISAHQAIDYLNFYETTI